MIVHSFSVTYLVIEDRLLLQARGDSESQNFWITRRGAAMLTQAIESLLVGIYQCSGIKNEHLEFARSFGQNHAETAHAPFSDHLHRPEAPPLLLFRVDYRPTGADTGKLTLLDESGNGQEFQLNTEMLHAISNLLMQQYQLAEWNAPLENHAQETPPLPNRAKLH